MGIDERGGAGIRRRVLSSLIVCCFLSGKMYADVAPVCLSDAVHLQGDFPHSFTEILHLCQAGRQTQPVLDAVESKGNPKSPPPQEALLAASVECEVRPFPSKSTRVPPEVDRRVQAWLTNMTVLREGLDVREIQGAYARSPSQVVGGVVENAQPMHSFVLTGGPGSCVLCLYALMGLGFYNAPHVIKKVSLGHMLEWSHDSDPGQIGHRMAVSPEALGLVQVCCLSQPEVSTNRLVPQCRHGIVISLWRKSQFTPVVLASRGPPLCA